jgi:SNF2 family DNA or RNA helicase
LLLFPVEASGKLHILDHLLAHLYAKKHKVLLFSQFTTVLDILQDYLTYREIYKYERKDVLSMDENVLYIKFIGLDGSVRSEERFLAINNFNVNEDTFIFLLSTKAGMENRIDFYKVYISIFIKVVLV